MLTKTSTHQSYPQSSQRGFTMCDSYDGPIALDALVDFDTRTGDFAYPFTFLAFPVEHVGEHGVPMDRDAESYIAAIQSEKVPVGIWTQSPVEGTAYAAVDQEQIPRLHEAIERLIERGDFTVDFAAKLCDRLFASERAQ